MHIKLTDGTIIAAHRCIIAARLGKMVPTGGIDRDATLPVNALPVVFDPFLKYVYKDKQISQDNFSIFVAVMRALGHLFII